MYINLYNMAKILRINKIQTTFFVLTKNKVNMLQQSEKHTHEKEVRVPPVEAP